MTTNAHTTIYSCDGCMCRVDSPDVGTLARINCPYCNRTTNARRVLGAPRTASRNVRLSLARRLVAAAADVLGGDR